MSIRSLVASSVCGLAVLGGMVATPAFAQNGTWTFNGNGTWTTDTNWSGSIIADGADNTATFGNTITTDSVVTLGTDRTIGNITASDTTHNYTISGANILTLDRTDATSPTLNVTTSGRTLTISSVIAGTDGLLKSGAGILSLTGSNTLTGNVVVNGGTLALVGTNAVTDITVNGSTLTSGGTSVGPATLGANGGTITFTGTSAYNPQRSITGAYNKNVAITSGTTTFNQSTQYYHETFSGVLSGNGTLVKNDSNGVLTFSNAANTFTGAIRLDNGSGGLVVNSLQDSASTIQFNGNSGAFSLGAGTASSLVFDSRQIVLSSTNTGTIANNNAGFSTITINTNLGFSGAGNRTLALGGSNTGLNTFSGNITNNGGSVTSVTKTGAGTWILSGTNSYSGVTGFNGAQNSGTLIFNGAESASANTTFSLSEGSTLGLRDDTPGTVVFGSPMQVNLTSQQTSARATTNINVNRVSTGSGSTLALGKLNFAGITDNRAAGATVNVAGGNEYKLQIASIDLDWGLNGTQNLNPTSASVIVAGTVRHIDGRPATGTVVQGQAVGTAAMTFVLDGTAKGNEITGSVQNAADYPSNPNALPLNLTKSNSSTWTLNGTNTYTGNTTVSGGKLLLGSAGSLAAGSAVTVSGGAIGGTGTINGTVTVSSTGGIDLRDNATGNLTLGSTLSITGAAGANNLYFDLGNATNTTDMIIAGGATSVTTAGAAVINLNQLGGLAGRNANGTYTLIQGTTSMDPVGDFALATTKAFGQTFALGVTGNNLELTIAQVTGATGNTTLTGNDWTVSGNFSAGLPDYESNVTINSAVGTASLNASQDINSLIYGTGATTATTVQAGTAASGTPFNMLVIEAGSANGNTAGNGITVNTPSSGTPLQTISANVGIASSQTWTVASGGNLTVSGVVSDFGGGYSLTKAGAGRLQLSNASSTYTGATIINAGTLDVSGQGASPLSSSSGVAFTGNSTFIYSGGVNVALPSMTVNSGVTADVRNSSSGSNSLHTMASLSGAGTFSADNPGGTGQGKGITFGDMSSFTGVLQVLNTGSSFFFTTPNLNDTVANNIRFAGNAPPTAQPFRFQYNGSAGLTLTNRAFEMAGPAGGNLTINNNGTNNSAFIINSNLAVTAAGAKTLTLGGTNAGGNSTFAGAITNGNGTISLTKADTNNWSLSSANNTFTGTITLSSTTTSAGTLSYASAGGANAISFLQTTGSATLAYTGSGQTMSGPITASALTTGTITLEASGTGAINYSNNGSLGSAASGIKSLILSGTNTGNNTLAGRWVNNTGAAATLTKNGLGTWILTGNNTYTGATTVNAGTLLINGDNSAATGAITVASGAFLGGTGTIGGNLSFAGTSLFDIADINDPLVVSGTVTFGAGFGIDNLVGVDWDSLNVGTPYTLISTSQTFTSADIGNFGESNAAPVGTGRFAYFQSGSLQLVVVPEPAAFALATCGLIGLGIAARRRRSRLSAIPHD